MLVSSIIFPYFYGISLSKEPYFLNINVDYYFADPTLYRFKLNISMRFNPTDDWTVVPIESYGDQTRNMMININPILQDFIRNSSGIENDVLFSYAGATLNAFFYMRLDATEYYDGVPVLAATSLNDYFNSGNDYIVYEGGLNTEKRGNPDFFPWKISKYPYVPFHTFKQSKRITLPNQHQYLTYSRQDGPTDTLSLRVKIFVNGTLSHTISAAYTFDAASAGYTPWVYDVNPNKLNILTLVPQATHYTVQMMEPDGYTPASELITYVIDRKYYKNTNYIIYKNNLSGYDTFTFRGEMLQKLDYDRTENMRSGRLNALSKFILRTSSAEETETFRFNTSLMGTEEIQELRSILLSDRIYLPMGLGYLYSKVIQITPTTKSIELIDSSKFMQQGYIEFRRTYNNESFIPPSYNY